MHSEEVYDMKDHVNNLAVANNISCFIPQGYGIKVLNKLCIKLLRPNAFPFLYLAIKFAAPNMVFDRHLCKKILKEMPKIPLEKFYRVKKRVLFHMSNNRLQLNFYSQTKSFKYG